MKTRTKLRRIVRTLRSLPSLGRDPLEFLSQLHANSLHPKSFQLGPRKWVSIVDPSAIEKLFVKHKNQTKRDHVTRELKSVLGRGLITSDGPLWKRQRRLIAPAFRPRDLPAYADAMILSAQEGLPTEDGLVSLTEAMTEITLAIVIRTLFGAEPDSEAAKVGGLLDEMMTCFEREKRTLWRVIPNAVPAKHRRRIQELSQTLTTLIHEHIEQARSEDLSQRPDLLARLLEARDDDGQAMDDVQLRDELVTLFLAGHETASITLIIALWLLAQHEHWQERLADELDGVELTSTNIRSLKVLNAVLNESMRLYPPAWTVGREATEPFEINGFRFEPGDQILVAQWAVHRHPSLWDNPTEFDPERWLDGRTDNLPRFAYFPFGGGQRVCVGSHFAQMEALLVLAVWVQQGTFTLDEVKPLDLLPAVTLRPREDVKVRMTFRT